jgi:hypothetical protein
VARGTGRRGLEGYLEPEHRAAFRSLIDQPAAPRPTTDAIADTRTTPQRNADALLELCGLARAAQDCPSTAGEPPHGTAVVFFRAVIDPRECAKRTTGGTGLIVAKRVSTTRHLARSTTPLCQLDVTLW